MSCEANLNETPTKPCCYCAASNRVEVDPSLIQNTLELTLEELNYVVNPRLLLLSEEQPVGVSSLAVLQTLLNA